MVFMLHTYKNIYLFFLPIHVNYFQVFLQQTPYFVGNQIQSNCRCWWLCKYRFFFKYSTYRTFSYNINFSQSTIYKWNLKLEIYGIFSKNKFHSKIKSIYYDVVVIDEKYKCVVNNNNNLCVYLQLHAYLREIILRAKFIAAADTKNSFCLRDILCIKPATPTPPHSIFSLPTIYECIISDQSIAQIKVFFYTQTLRAFIDCCKLFVFIHRTVRREFSS